MEKLPTDSFDFSDDEDEVVIAPVKAQPKFYSTPVTKKLSESYEIITEVSNPTPQAAPFGIVLIDIKKAAEERRIHCEDRFLDGQTPYVALSYRWGELDEQMVPATKDYNARIVSFQFSDFFRLCQAMVHEPDLQHIQYVWVDAICVNQHNMEKRKATIYRMNDIYIQAAAIVAVPDLHAFHLATTTTANADTMAIIRRYRKYLYYLLVGTTEAQQTLAEMDHAWMDTLGIPPLDAHRQDLVLSQTPELMPQIISLMAMPPSENPQAKADHYQQLACRMMIECQRIEWQQKLDQRKSEIIQSMKFLQSLMEDWSNRTWVISEYHIARRKNGKLKFWYNQLSHPDLHGFAFFEFDFAKQVLDQHDATFRQQHPFTSNIIFLSRKFKGSMRRRLTKRSVVEMMLQTKASKHEDRFHSIIPLAPKYKHHIKDRDSIAAFGISDMLSVRLKLLEWMDTKDRLNLLYSGNQPSASTLPFLPTFATHLKTVKPGLLKLITQHPQCNYDLDDPSSVRLVRKDRDELWLLPRVYRVPHPHKPRRRSYQQDLCKDFGLDPKVDLDVVSIPLFDIDTREERLLASDIQLLGSWEKNIWVFSKFCSSYKDTTNYPNRKCALDKDTLPQGFRIY